MILVSVKYAQAGTFHIIDYPTFSSGSWPSNLQIQTFVYGIKGNYVTGTANAGNNEAFTYDLSNGLFYNNGSSRYLYQNNGTRAVGTKDHGASHADYAFVLNIPTGGVVQYLNFSPKDVSNEFIIGTKRIDVGGNVETRGVLFNTQTQLSSVVSFSTATYTEFYSISQNKIFGRATGNGISTHFLYDISGDSFLTLNLPGNFGWYDYDEGRVAGAQFAGGSSTGAVYDLAQGNLISFSAPTSSYTVATTVDGSKVGGYFFDDSTSRYRGFVYSVPEPSSLSLLALGGVLVVLGRRKRA